MATNTNDHTIIYSLATPIKNKCEFGRAESIVVKYCCSLNLLHVHWSIWGFAL